ncbi:endonuclease/exonuclease/phosphatase family protein [Streptomyces sp. BE230]|uniref:endonuclease/exonuclease/phosphatase family protein n=1 Tax=Streptomyces sp. BE230 TaxID=3002526 RepID=UPI002ED48707|nr:endonuclease/exonuclease/phosphatase family protein [Streptomyces sp. BE230]
MKRRTDVLRVATLNIWNRSGPWLERLPLIRRELELLEPDVIGLQEVFADVGPDDAWEEAASGVAAAAMPRIMHDTCQAVEIAQGLGYEVAYAPASDQGVAKRPPGNRRIQGNAVLSRAPIRSVSAVWLPTSRQNERRSLLRADIPTPWGELAFFTTHLSWGSEHARERSRQAQFIVSRVLEAEGSARSAALPAIIVGDFNAEAHEESVRWMVGGVPSGTEGAPFTDAWNAGGGVDGATFDPRNAYVAARDESARRIDYIVVSQRQARYAFGSMTAELAFATPAQPPSSGLWPSDHFGVVADLSVKPGSTVMPARRPRNEQ